MRKIFLLISIAFISYAGITQSGTLDPTFGNNGYILTSASVIGNNNFEFAKQCFIHPDGKLSVVLQTSGKTVISRRLSNGNRDLSYGKNSFSNIVSMTVTSAAIQQDGKIVVAGTTNGTSDFMIARYNTDGILDASFGSSGVTITDMGSNVDFLNSIVITSDGKIIAGGSSQRSGIDRSILIRYTSGGMPDITFGNIGIVITNFDDRSSTINSLALQTDGKIVAAGTVGSGDGGDFALARYNENGSPDLGFNAIGRTTTSFGSVDRANSVILQSDGKIYVGGFSSDASGYQHFRIARYNTNGSPDLSYNFGSGSVSAVFGDSFDFLTNLRLQADGKLLAAGHTSLNPSYDIELVRLNNNGSIDNSFGTNGLVLGDINSSYDESTFLVIQPDGKILTGGDNGDFSKNPPYDFSIFRYDATGLPDPTFGNGGNIIDYSPGSYFSYGPIHVQSDGKLLIASGSNDGTTFKTSLSRFNTNGTADNSYGQNGNTDVDFQSGSVIFQADGKIVDFGYSTSNGGDFMISRYNIDGSADISFGINGTVITDLGGNESPTQAAFQNDGKIIIGGRRFTTNGSDLVIIRYNTNGSLDATFGNGGSISVDIQKEEYVQAIALQADGKILIGGTGYSYPPDFSYVHFDVLMVRLNSNGSIDNSFADQGKKIIDKTVYDNLGSFVIQSDGKILYTYYAATEGPDLKCFLERINPDGSPDTNFGQNGQIACDAFPLFLQNDQKIIIVGNKINSLNNIDFTLARFNQDGSPDNSFGNNGKTIFTFTGIDNNIFTGLISENILYVSGNGIDKTGNNVGIISKFRLESLNSIRCPVNQVVSADKNSCSAKVYNIDPVLTPANNAVEYKLTGATIGSGIGSVSGKSFNKGITTVTYTLTNDPSLLCSFTVTVQDKEPPVIENLSASLSTLWPPDHKMKDIIVNYRVTDNCGPINTQVSVESNEPVSSNERDDKSPDWQILDNNHIKLRAERLESGSGRVYTIKVNSTDAAGNQFSKSITVTVPKNNAPICDLNVSAAPNPTNNFFIISLISTCNTKVNLRLLNVRGDLINTISNISPPQSIKIGDRLLPGIYYLEATQGGTKKTIKLVKH